MAAQVMYWTNSPRKVRILFAWRDWSASSSTRFV